MKSYSVFNTEGHLVRTGNCSPETFELQAGPGETVQEGLTEFVREIPELSYSSKRLKEYPSLGDQLDALWHGMDTGTLAISEPFYSTIKAVKDKYPKSL